MRDNPNPVLVEVHRGAQVESSHRGSVVVVDTAGRVVFSAGRASRPVYPRSALKIFQAIPLLESGAARRFGLDAEEIALACASHNAEAFHVRAVLRWLHRLGLEDGDLECGPQWPLRERAAHDLIARGAPPARVHHNCSGKHAGMLAVAGFLNAGARGAGARGVRGYSEYDHPVQRAWMQTLSELLDLDVFALPWERDGCGLPAVCMPLEHLARAFACYADTAGVGAKFGTARGAAVARILAALRAHPRMIAGTGRCCTDVLRETKGRVLIKTGAEGVYGGVIPHLGVGFALKIDDGASRAAEVALGALLKKLGALEAASAARLKGHFEPAVVNSQGRVTGRIAPAANWSR